VLALEVRTGIATVLASAMTAMVALAGAPGGRPCHATDTSVAMPEPAPEPVIVREAVTAPLTCEDPGIQTIVFKGRVNALGDDQTMTFHFRFADLPDRYTVMTGPHGEFEVRVSRSEIGLLDLCTLPMSGLRPARFTDAQLSIGYALSFERWAALVALLARVPVEGVDVDVKPERRHVRPLTGSIRERLAPGSVGEPAGHSDGALAVRDDHVLAQCLELLIPLPLLAAIVALG